MKRSSEHACRWLYSFTVIWTKTTFGCITDVFPLIHVILVFLLVFVDSTKETGTNHFSAADVDAKLLLCSFVSYLYSQNWFIPLPKCLTGQCYQPTNQQPTQTHKHNLAPWKQNIQKPERRAKTFAQFCFTFLMKEDVQSLSLSLSVELLAG